MSAQPVDIQIFGRSLRVNCPLEKQEELHQYANDLNQRLQNLQNRTKVTHIEQLIFIVALNLCHELAQERVKNYDYACQIEQNINTLQQVVEQTLLKLR
ncbi:Cell division protein ZapA [Candidatus Profftia lariciata]|uniref:cell division protein ZapA n=1 Tax=Candidatus Profftia lariciata TaxID=1987921 RepID=UPI001D006E66|nr:cell division protein ZapA [Candidatus Profftia lariciata]UDG81406.1 Cell division protein ZapA [Candidatus Profftia lariciata]